jgi:hypothetical protein
MSSPASLALASALAASGADTPLCVSAGSRSVTTTFWRGINVRCGSTKFTSGTL